MITPTIAPKILVAFKDLLKEFQMQDLHISAGVGVIGEAAAYAEVWEWGNLRQAKEGPKTILGTNPDGDSVWLSVQAPSGYIKINESQYWDIYREELDKLKFDSVTPEGIREELERAHRNTAVRCAVLVSNTAPVDSGQLAESVVPILPGDDSLNELYLGDEEDNERVLLL